MTKPVWRSYSIPAGNGPLYVADKHGQLVADILIERVKIERGTETREVVKTGKRAIAL